MLKAIKSKQQYENILVRIYALMQQKVKEGSKQFMELEVLSVLATVYEMTHKPLGGI